MLKKVCFLIFFLAFLFFFPIKSYAVSVVINNPPSTIGSDPFQLSVTVTGASSGTNYLRVDLYKDGTTNYFGETFNGSSWYSDSDGKQYLPVTVPSDNPFTIQARIGNTMPGDYDGTGTYKLRIRRYTAGGNYNNDEAKASVVTVAINFPTVTPTPSHTPTPTNAPTPTKIPMSTQSPTKMPTPTPLRPTSPLATQDFEGQVKISPSVTVASHTAYPKAVLAAKISLHPTPQKSSKEKVMVKESNNTAAVIGSCFMVAALFLSACAILVYRRIKHARDSNDE